MAPIKDQIQLAPDLIKHWYSAVGKVGRFPQGTTKSQKEDLDPDTLDALIKQEKKNIQNLWTTFTQERSDIRRSLLAPKEQAVAYLLGFHLSNAARLQSLLKRVEFRHSLSKTFKRFSSVQVTDLGCGTGAMSQGLLDFWGDKLPSGELHLTDAVGGLLDCARLVHENEQRKLRTFRKNIEELPIEKMIPESKETLLILQFGYVWNELEKNPKAKSKMAKLFEKIAKTDHPALILFVDSSEQSISRSLMGLRDQLSGFGLNPLFPCTQSNSCPLLERSRDWCFSEALWQRPKFVNRVDRLLGIDHGRLTATMLAFSTDSLYKPAPQDSASIVGRPESKEGNSFEYLLCGKNGIEKSPKVGEEIRLRGTIFKKTPNV